MVRIAAFAIFDAGMRFAITRSVYAKILTLGVSLSKMKLALKVLSVMQYHEDDRVGLSLSLLM